MYDEEDYIQREHDEWFRGSNKVDPLAPSSMDADYNATEQFGPGVYFTNDYSVADSYGTVQKYFIDTSKGFYRTGDPIDIEKIKEILLYMPEEDLGIFVGNYDENPTKGLAKALKSIKSYCDDMPDALSHIAHEAFRDDTDEFLMDCRASGVYGVVLTDPFKAGRGSLEYLILYDPKKAKFRSL